MDETESSPHPPSCRQVSSEDAIQTVADAPNESSEDAIVSQEEALSSTSCGERKGAASAREDGEGATENSTAAIAQTEGPETAAGTREDDRPITTADTKENAIDDKRPSLVFFDLETTGLSTERDRIVEIALIKRDGNGTETELQFLVNPGIPIPMAATNVHGISNKDVAHQPSFADVVDQVIEFIGDADLGGHNVAKYDLPLLQAELKRVKKVLEMGERKIWDTLIAFRKKEPHTLAKALEFYCHRPIEGAHRALADAKASLSVLDAQRALYNNDETAWSADPPVRSRPPARFSSSPAPPAKRAKIEGKGSAEMKNGTDRDEDEKPVLTDASDRVDPGGKFRWVAGEAVISFGKHRGQTIREIIAIPSGKGYFTWLLNEHNKKPRDCQIYAKVIRQAAKGQFPVRGPAPPSSPPSSS